MTMVTSELPPPPPGLGRRSAGWLHRRPAVRLGGLLALPHARPIGYFMARVASPPIRNVLIVAAIVPLWASYLIKVYSWRLILAEEGILNWALGPLGLKGPGFGDVAVWLVFTYIWLPYMILPVYAGFERIPRSLLEASADLGARSWTTFRRSVLPLVFPALGAGPLFPFFLTPGASLVPAPV